MGDACGPSNLPSVKEEGEEEESFGTKAKRKKRGGGVAQSKIMFRCKFTSFERERERECHIRQLLPPESQSIPRLSVSRELYNFNLASACRVEHFDEGWTNVREEWKDEVSTYGRICNDLYFAILNSWDERSENWSRAEDERSESRSLVAHRNKILLLLLLFIVSDFVCF